MTLLLFAVGISIAALLTGAVAVSGVAPRAVLPAGAACGVLLLAAAILFILAAVGGNIAA
jgi:hypothetical protein